MLSFGDYTGGNTPDSQSYATQVYGGPGEQHSVGSVDGGNENNVIATRYVSNCSMSGGRRSTRKSRKHSKKSKRVQGGMMDKSKMKSFAKMAIKEEMEKMKKGGDLSDIVKSAVDKTVSTGNVIKNAVKDSATTILNKGSQLKDAVQNTFSRQIGKGGKLNKTLKKMIRKEMRK